LGTIELDSLAGKLAGINDGNTLHHWTSRFRFSQTNDPTETNILQTWIRTLKK
jgi:hypothetical protein